jgi:tetratricopeptide (TPR) repeat protein
MRSAAVGLAALLVFAVCLEAAGQPRQAGLTGAAALGRVYDFILDASFERAEAELPGACHSVPAVACKVLDTTLLWWRIQMDPENRSLDESFTRKVNGVIASAEEWVELEPALGEAWFYLGASYGLRVNWRVLRGEKLAAARDGKRIKQSLDRAVELDPSLEDAYFGLGMYRYYADVAPLAARLLRRLLLLPGGDRARGLQEMERARDRGVLLSGEIDYQLHFVYLWYEKEHSRGLELLERLHARYPHNPLFLERIAAAHESYFGNASASLASYQALLERALRGLVNFSDAAEVQARIGAARHLDAMHETDRAVEHLLAVVRLRPEAPHGALSLAHLRLGEGYDRIGLRRQAAEHYARATATAPPGDPFRIRRLVREAERRPVETRSAEGYRLALEGWRAVERSDLAQAWSLLGKSVALRPHDPVTRFRLGKLYVARGDDEAALDEMQYTINARPAPPPVILAAAYLEAGSIHRRAGRHAQAVEMYRGVMRVHGADEQTRETAINFLARTSRSNTSIVPRSRD